MSTPTNVELLDAIDHLLVAVRGAAAIMGMAAMSSDEPHEWVADAMLLTQLGLEQAVSDAEGIVGRAEASANLDADV